MGPCRCGNPADDAGVRGLTRSSPGAGPPRDCSQVCGCGSTSGTGGAEGWRMTSSSDYLAASVDLLLGGACVGCLRAGHSLCSACGRHLEGMPRRVTPTPAPDGLPPVFGVASYDGVARAVILAHKEQGRLSLARPLGRALAIGCFAALTTTQKRPTLVHLVPAPSIRSRVRERGHDPLLRIARECRRAMRSAGIAATVRQVLRVVRAVDDQAALSSRARRDNLRAAFEVGGRVGLEGRAVILLDDVITTGTTAAESTRALTAAGAEVIAVSVVAATALRCGGDRDSATTTPQ